MRKILGYATFTAVCLLSVLTASGYVDLTGIESIFFVLCMAAITAVAIHFLTNEKTDTH